MFNRDNYEDKPALGSTERGKIYDVSFQGCSKKYLKPILLVHIFFLLHIKMITAE